MEYYLSTLTNGLRVASERLPGMESVAVSVAVDVGARYESEAENGISHLLEHMAFKGTERRSARQIAEEFDHIGGQFNAYTSLEHTVYYAKVLKEYLPVALDILADILQHSQFTQDELTREKGVICQEIAMHQDSPDDVVVDLFDATAYPTQPMGRPILGTEERINGFDRDHLFSYMGSHYSPKNMVISAAGNVDHKELVKLCEAHFTALKDNAPKPFEPARYAGGGISQEKDLEQLQLMLGLPVEGVHHADFHALQLYANILGGGMSSRLFQEVREKRGLAYHVSAGITAYADCGTLSIYSATGEAQGAELPLILIDELKCMADAVTPEELTRAKNQQKSELIMARESPGTVAGWMGKHLLVYGRYKMLAEILERIDSVTINDLRRIGEGLLSKPLTVASLGLTKSVPDYNAIIHRLGQASPCSGIEFA